MTKENRIPTGQKDNSENEEAQDLERQAVEGTLEKLVEFQDIAWQVWHPIDCKVHIAPRDSCLLSGDPDGKYALSVVLRVKCSNNYPATKPQIELLEPHGISIADMKVLEDLFHKTLDELEGQVVIYALWEIGCDFLTNLGARPKGSFHDDMMADKERTEAERKRQRNDTDRKEVDLLDEIAMKQKNVHEEKQPVKEEKVGETKSIGGRRIIKATNVPVTRAKPSNNCTEYMGFWEGREVLISEWIFRYKTGGAKKKDFGPFLKKADSVYSDLQSLCELKNVDTNIAEYEFVHMEKTQRNDQAIVQIFIAQNIYTKEENLEDKMSQLGIDRIRMLAACAICSLRALHEGNRAHQNFKKGCVWMTDTSFRFSDFESVAMMANLTKLFNEISSGKVPTVVEEKKMSDLRREDLFQFGVLLLAIDTEIKKNTSLPYSQASTPVGQDSSENTPLHQFINKCQEAKNCDNLHLEPFISEKPASEDSIFMTPFGGSMNPSGRMLSDNIAIKLLGKGGFGDVVLVRNNLDQIDYAIKRIPLTANSDKLNKKITKEAKFFAKLNHTNVVRNFNAWAEELIPVEEEESSDDDCAVPIPGKGKQQKNKKQKSVESDKLGDGDSILPDNLRKNSNENLANVDEIKKELAIVTHKRLLPVETVRADNIDEWIISSSEDDDDVIIMAEESSRSTQSESYDEIEDVVEVEHEVEGQGLDDTIHSDEIGEDVEWCGRSSLPDNIDTLLVHRVYLADGRSRRIYQDLCDTREWICEQPNADELMSGICLTSMDPETCDQCGEYPPIPAILSTLTHAHLFAPSCFLRIRKTPSGLVLMSSLPDRHEVYSGREEGEVPNDQNKENKRSSGSPNTRVSPRTASIRVFHSGHRSTSDRVQERDEENVDLQSENENFIIKTKGFEDILSEVSNSSGSNESLQSEKSQSASELETTSLETSNQKAMLQNEEQSDFQNNSLELSKNANLEPQILKELQEKNNTIVKLEVRINELQRSTSSLQQRYDNDFLAMRQKLEAAESSLCAQQEMNAKMEARCDVLKQKHSSESDHLKEENERLSESLKKHSQKIEEMIDDRIVLVDKMQLEIEFSEFEKRQALDELVSCKLAITNSAEKIKVLEKELARTQELEKTKTTALVNLTEEEKEKIRIENDSFKMQLENSNKALQEQREESKKILDSEIRKQKKLLKISEKSRQDAEAKTQEAMSEYQKLQTEMSEMKALVEAVHSDDQSKLAELKRDLEVANTANQDLVKKLDILSKAIVEQEENNKKIEELNEERIILKTRQEELGAEIEALSAMLDKAEASIKEEDLAKTKLTSTIAALEFAQKNEELNKLIIDREESQKTCSEQWQSRYNEKQAEKLGKPANEQVQELEMKLKIIVEENERNLALYEQLAGRQVDRIDTMFLSLDASSLRKS